MTDPRALDGRFWWRVVSVPTTPIHKRTPLLIRTAPFSLTLDLSFFNVLERSASFSWPFSSSCLDIPKKASHDSEALGAFSREMPGNLVVMATRSLVLVVARPWHKSECPSRSLVGMMDG